MFNEMIAKITELVKTHASELFLVVIIASITVISFNIGRMSASNSLKSRITVQEANIVRQTGNTGLNPSKNVSAGEVVASKNSTLYHFSWCSSASRIAPQNKLTFATEAAAISAGYTLAANCSK